MKNNNLLVSVIITARNSERTLNSCLNSIKEQSYKNTEIIVVDNNSKDGTKEIIKGDKNERENVCSIQQQ